LSSLLKNCVFINKKEDVSSSAGNIHTGHYCQFIEELGGDASKVLDLYTTADWSRCLLPKGIKKLELNSRSCAALVLSSVLFTVDGDRCILSFPAVQ